MSLRSLFTQVHPAIYLDREHGTHVINIICRLVVWANGITWLQIRLERNSGMRSMCKQSPVRWTAPRLLGFSSVWWTSSSHHSHADKLRLWFLVLAVLKQTQKTRICSSRKAISAWAYPYFLRRHRTEITADLGDNNDHYQSSTNINPEPPTFQQ